MTTFALILIVITVSILGCAGWFQERMLFFPDKLDEDKDLQWTGASEEVFLDTEDGARIHGLFFEADRQARGVVLYFHGNAGSVASWYQVALELSQYEVDVLLIDYRTYGKSRGDMSEEGLYHDGQAAYDYLLEQGIEPPSIVVHGRSVGSAVATYVAHKNEVGGLVLETPFTSLVTLASELYPFLAPRQLLRYEMDNLSRVVTIEAPTWVVHGTADRIVPVEHGRQVFEAGAGAWELTIIDGGGHNDLMDWPDYHRDLQRFYDFLFESEEVDSQELE